METLGPDLLALHSCVICHEIFTTEADLLDHTISLHTSTSENTIDTQATFLPPISSEKVGAKVVEGEHSVYTYFNSILLSQINIIM